MDNDYAAGIESARRAVALARQAREADLVAMALTVQGRALFRAGDVATGVACLDEAILEIAEGTVSIHASGAAYCTAIDGCQEIFDFRRAKEWTAALSQFLATQPGILSFSGLCLVHRSTIHQLEGRLKDAEAEAEEALRRFEVADSFGSGLGWYRLAEVQRAQGSEAAEASYRRASEFGEDPQPGLGLLWLSQGKVQAALAAVERALTEAKDLCRRARFLPALVEIAIAAGDTEKAQAAAASLEEVSSTFKTSLLGALAAKASGAVHLAGGDLALALPLLRDSQQLFRRLGIPIEEAHVRLLIARACRLVGDHDSASLEEAAANKAFESVAHEGASTPSKSIGLSRRELEVLKLLATGLSNQAIADELYLAVRTIDRHVSNIFTKLGVKSRTAAASYAYRHALLRDG